MSAPTNRFRGRVLMYDEPVAAIDVVRGEDFDFRDPSRRAAGDYLSKRVHEWIASCLAKQTRAQHFVLGNESGSIIFTKVPAVLSLYYQREGKAHLQCAQRSHCLAERTQACLRAIQFDRTNPSALTCPFWQDEPDKTNPICSSESLNL
jgi:hypothetical protein